MKYKIIILSLLLVSTPLLASNHYEKSPREPQNEFETLALILTKYGQNTEGLPPLIFSIIQNDKTAFELLIKYGASPFITSGGYTCLYHAVKEGHLEFVGRLIELGLDPLNAPNGYDNDMLLNVAIRYNRNDIAKYLIEYGVPLYYKNSELDYLRSCARYGNLEIFNILLSKGVTITPLFRQRYPSAIASIPQLNQYWTPSEDFQLNKIEILRYLLDNKFINPDECFDQYSYFFRESVEYFDLQKEMITILIHYGANLNCVDKKGNTPLKLATGSRMREFLIDLGAK